ncbi:MAG: hypothetical protein R3F17_04320 [Planctomycetota bacterium]
MSQRPRQFAILLLVMALALYVYAPLLPAGLFGGDFSALAAVAGWSGTWPEWFRVPETDGRPLAALSLYASQWLWAAKGGSVEPVWSEGGVMILRLENIALLLVASFGLRAVLRQALQPFLGAEQARSAGVTAGLFLFLHPLGVSTVARVAERGELIAAAAGALAMSAFLRARQGRTPRAMGVAIALALVAAFAGRIAYLLPPLAGLLEFLSARRHRAVGRRLRTAGVIAAACFALVSIEWLVRTRYAPATLGPQLTSLPQLDGIALALEKLGVLLLPVDTYGIGKVGYALAVIALLLALHPGFVAARSAPRLWGRILLGWAISLILVEALSIGAASNPKACAAPRCCSPRRSSWPPVPPSRPRRSTASAARWCRPWSASPLPCSAAATRDPLSARRTCSPTCAATWWRWRSATAMGAATSCSIRPCKWPGSTPRARPCRSCCIRCSPAAKARARLPRGLEAAAIRPWRCSARNPNSAACANAV